MSFAKISCGTPPAPCGEWTNLHAFHSRSLSVNYLVTRPTVRTNAADTASTSSSSFPGAATADYETWATSAGITFPKVTQTYFGGLRGSQAVENIAPNETFVAVPRDAALVVEPTAKCPCTDFVDAGFWKQAPWFVKMAVLLLREASKGRESQVWGYVEQLPQTIDTPVRWTADEVAELQFEPIQKSITEQRKLWKEQHQALVRSVKNAQGGNASSMSWERFCWAAENVRSRAFSGPYAGAPLSERLRLAGVVAAAGSTYVAFAHVPLEQALNGAIAAAVFNLLYDIILSSKLKWFALCPIIDSINHSSKVESTIEFEYFKDKFVASTSTACVKGDQVFISYGAQSNDSLFQYYAFVEQDNPYDTYTFDASINGRTLTLTLTAKGLLAPESSRAAREACSDAVALQLALAAAIDAELERLPTSLEEDERSLKTAHLMAPRLKAALEYRLIKKKVLKKAAERAKRRAAKRSEA